MGFNNFMNNLSFTWRRWELRIWKPGRRGRRPWVELIDWRTYRGT